IVESQIMHLLGVRPAWDKRGKVTGVEVIPSGDLNHPRIDTIMVPSGLYRDVFSNLMALLDKSVSLARGQDESDNLLRANVLARRDELLKQGVSKEKALRLASVRIFTEEPGSYGTGLCDVIPLSGTWENEKEVADVYFLRMSHMFGQGFWGNRAASCSGPGVEKKISKELFKKALSGTKMSVHSLSSNVYATLDNDDFFQYLGGTAMAVRAVDGETPEMYVSDMSDPNAARQVTLARVMGTEMRTRYLNPKWIDKMMAEGYAGARFVDKVVEHLWGWQVTAPEVVDSAKWQEMYETYVEDKYDLNLKQKFKEAGNTWAHQSIVARMLEVVRKNYWDPDREVVQRLAKEYAESVKKEGLACCDHTCNNPALTEYTRSTLTSVPGLENLAKEMADSLEEIKRTRASSRPKASNPGNKTADASSPSPEPAEGQPQQVEGYEMEETTSGSSASAPIPYLFLVFFLGFLGVMFWGWKQNQKAG
ncbi:MAG: cobaltochelatase subunit CobN, partial [Planctomycetes bacterium]|nr:cobaltochelatase subunit CobN [Planctomycetota bacterium]